MRQETTMEMASWAIEQFLRFALVTVRVSGVLITAPAMTGDGVPRRVKVALAGMVALVLLPVLPEGGVTVSSLDLRGLLLAVLGEGLVGMAIGLAAGMVLVGFELGGLLIGQQTGLAFANVLDPLSGSQVSVMGRFYRFLTLVVFLGIGGHRMLILALCRSYEVAPLGAVWVRENSGMVGSLPMALVEMGGRMFTVALSVAAPVVVSLVLTTVALGLIARTVPQMNILAVGFPVRILIGWAAVLLSLGAVVVFARGVLMEMFEELLTLTTVL